ncbi:EcsC family protein [Luteimonas sp. SX5]|uniref:EcsC family protein n=1 Tax=Luteimonas galliterrae TaxID=2940486 RepID=A0ABT0MMI3_9GAMM|nr:EcsC family protein [Luteimonas galliterrae]MCL1636101.1 EcsC family protein [Luteimonas galliterrae]
MSKSSVLIASLTLIVLGAAPAAAAQRYSADDIQQALSGIDIDALIGEAGGVLMRAPDSAIDGLFQAVHASSQVPKEADTMCGLLEPDADRSLEAIGRAAQRLGPDSRQKFATAVAEIATTGLQNPPQPYDEVAARQVLKSAGVTAMLLHDGFLLGLNSTGSDRASRDARCRSMRWMLDALQDVPQAQRASATRLLLNEGLTLLAQTR